MLAMGAQSRLFTSLGSGSGKSTAVVACAVLLLAGCGGPAEGASEGGAPAVRGEAPTSSASNAAGTSSLTVAGDPSTAAVGATIALTSAGGTGTGTVTYATTGTVCAVTASSLTATAAGACSVIATNGTQTSSPVTFTFTDAAAQVEKPGFPAITNIVVGDGMATLTVVPWTSGGTPTSYAVRVLAAVGQTGNPGTCTVTGARGSCDVTGLTNGSRYTAYATAKNAAGSGPSSKAAELTPAAGPGAPATPAISTQAAGTGSVSVSVAPGTGGGPPDSYTVRAYALMASTAARTCTVTVAPGSCNVTGLTKGHRYTVKASATNAAGTSFESRSVTVVAD